MRVKNGKIGTANQIKVDTDNFKSNAVCERQETIKNQKPVLDKSRPRKTILKATGLRKFEKKRIRTAN